jgi:hypothetical protein
MGRYSVSRSVETGGGYAYIKIGLPHYLFGHSFLHKRPQPLRILPPIVPFRGLHTDRLMIFPEFILVSVKEILYRLPMHLKNRFQYPRIECKGL